jgi:hypothetical protein
MEIVAGSGILRFTIQYNSNYNMIIKILKLKFKMVKVENNSKMGLANKKSILYS